MAGEHGEGFEKLVDEARAKIRECTVADVFERHQNGEELQLIDVREDGEWLRGHLPGARHLGKGIIERDIEAVVPDRTTELILYCGGGYRSALAGAALQQMGYTNVISMDGGIRGWRQAGHPLEID